MWCRKVERTKISKEERIEFDPEITMEVIRDAVKSFLQEIY